MSVNNPYKKQHRKVALPIPNPKLEKEKRRSFQNTCFIKENGEVDVEALDAATDEMFGMPNRASANTAFAPNCASANTAFDHSRNLAVEEGNKKRLAHVHKYPELIRKYPGYVEDLLRKITPSSLSKSCHKALKSVNEELLNVKAKASSDRTIPASTNQSSTPNGLLPKQLSVVTPAVDQPQTNDLTQPTSNVANGFSERDASIALAKLSQQSANNITETNQDIHQLESLVDDQASYHTSEDYDNYDDATNGDDISVFVDKTNDNTKELTGKMGTRDKVVACMTRCCPSTPPPSLKDLQDDGYFVLPKTPPMRADKMFGVYNKWRPPIGIDPRVHQADKMIGANCLGCSQDKNLCHEVVFGMFCVHVVLDLFEEMGLEMDDEDLKNIYEFSYQFLLRFLTFDMIRKYNLKGDYELPSCMVEGSFAYAQALINWKRNVLYTNNMRCHLGDVLPDNNDADVVTGGKKDKEGDNNGGERKPPFGVSLVALAKFIGQSNKSSKKRKMSTA